MIKTCDKGYSRFVLLIGPYAIKVPYFRWGWFKVVSAVYMNLKEVQIYNYVARQHPEHLRYLCPVVRPLLGGLLLVMRRAETGLCEQDISTVYRLRIRAARLHADDKCENYGRIDGRIVKLDYADCYSVFD